MAAKTEPQEAKKKSKFRIVIPIALMVVGMGSGGYFSVLAPKQAAAEAAAASTTTEVHVGKIVRLAPITMNLSDGHILKVGLAMQMIAEPKEEELNALVGVEASSKKEEGGAKEAESATMTLGGLESKALDVMISELGSSNFETLSSPEGRAHAKKLLAERIVESYEGDVVEVYFTDFVMS